MGQEESVAKHKQFHLQARGDQKKPLLLAQRLEHEGLLKLREIPFRNSIEISQQPPVFLESADATLRQLLQSRYNTTKLFTEEDVVKLAESVLYTLSFLESRSAAYPDLCQENIFYDAQTASFKLLPMELIRESGYQLATSGRRFSLLAPELVLALRYGEQEIEAEILNKSNVFTLGMILLETLTLTSSEECYDPESYDILDEIVSAKIQTVRQFYPEFLVKLLERMLEYDYSERSSIKQLSIEMNREVSESRVMSRPQVKAPSSYSQIPSNTNTASRATNLGKSQLRYQQVQPREDPPSAFPPFRLSNQYPPQQTVSPSRVKNERAQPEHPALQQSSISHVTYVNQHHEQPTYPPPQMYAQQDANRYRYSYVEEEETPRYKAATEQLEEASDQDYTLNYLYQRPQQNVYHPSCYAAQEAPKQAQHYYQAKETGQQYAPMKQPQYTNSSEQQFYHSPIDETREPRRHPNEAKYLNCYNAYKPVVAVEVERKPAPEENPSPKNRAFKEHNQQRPAGVQKSPSKRRVEYVSPLREEEQSDSSIVRLKEEIQKSRRLIMEFQRLEGLAERQQKPTKILPV